MPEDKPSDEEMAFKLVSLYVSEVSRKGEKRQMGLDTIINAYFYTLLRLKKKRKEMEYIEPAVKREEEELASSLDELPIPQMDDQFNFD